MTAPFASGLARGAGVRSDQRWSTGFPPGAPQNTFMTSALGGSAFPGGKAVSWWGKLRFREFHFLWQPGIDFAYVEAHKPDVVICQTIERFLKQIPGH